MSANLEAKKQVVEEIKEKIQNSKSVVFVDYKGLTVAEVSDLRNKFRAAGRVLQAAANLWHNLYHSILSHTSGTARPLHRAFHPGHEKAG